MHYLPFGSWLREYRRTRDLTRQDLAELIGCSVETIRKIEAGERRPSKQIARLLAERLDISPTDRSALEAHARATISSANYAAGSATLPDAGRPPNNLPAPLTRIIGRQGEIGLAGRYLTQTRARLLTLVGPPGVGKTRLAVQAAHDFLPSWPDGVFFVPLAQVLDPSLVLGAVAGRLGIEVAGGQPLRQRLVEYLHNKRMLLLLDNFEQLTEAAPYVLELLESCPHLKVLVTSREPLHVTGEQELPVPPLDPPNLDGPLTADVVSGSAAVELFVERAQAVQPDFTLDDSNAPSVAGICARLEGLPLAIELIAARVKMLPPQALLELMGGKVGQQWQKQVGLHLLEGGQYGPHARYRTLREAINWSYTLLSETERRLFVRLSVFSGGCTLIAIEAVCNPRGDLGVTVFDIVRSLLDKSLLRQTQAPVMGAEDQEPRFAMLETIRSYATQQMEAGGEADRTRRLHADYYLAIAEAADPQLTGADQKRWLDRLERDHDNLRAALAWLLDVGDVQMAAQLAVALKRFWEVHNHFAEGRRWLTQLLARPETDNIPPALKAKALNAAGALAIAQSDYDSAFSFLSAGLALQRDLGDQLGVASALNNLGMAALSKGKSEEAVPFFEEGLQILRNLGDKARTATMLGNFAVVISQQGGVERAAQLLSESLALRRELGNRWGIAAALGNLAEILRSQHKYERAREVYREVLTLLNELGDKVGTAKALEGFAALELAEGRPERSARLLSVVEDLLASSGAALSTVDQEEHTRLVDSLHATLDASTLKDAWAQGRKLALEQAISYALRG
jgi:predicted ATPase/transcriptional regulator with XRE-family HTH domain